MSPETEARLLEDVGAIKANVEHLLGQREEPRARIGAIERKMWWGSGAVAVVAAVIVPKVRATLGI
jgi:hypothetical protein